MKTQPIEDISILLAEDEADLRSEIAEYLKLLFKRVYLASDGIEALDIYKQKHPDVILTDINMPRMSGLELVGTIRESDKTTKIVILSAHSDKDKLLNAIKLHLESYLIKPVKMDELKSLLLSTVDEIKKTQKRIYVSDETYWDQKSGVLCYKGEEVVLKNKETLLLKLLFSKPTQIFSAQAIFKQLHPQKSKEEFSTYAVTSLIKRLRIKLPEDIIQNIYGSGYKIINN
ncbi:MAG: response regulator [Sulfuricurvum sp.]